MENWKGRTAFSESGFICQQRSGRSEQCAGLSVGRGRGGHVRQLLWEEPGPFRGRGQNLQHVCQRNC